MYADPVFLKKREILRLITMKVVTDSADIEAEWRLQAFPASFSRISPRRILPLIVLGSSGTNSTIRGYL
jgi:hypothetical protein